MSRSFPGTESRVPCILLGLRSIRSPVVWPFLPPPNWMALPSLPSSCLNHFCSHRAPLSTPHTPVPALTVLLPPTLHTPCFSGPLERRQKLQIQSLHLEGHEEGHWDPRRLNGGNAGALSVVPTLPKSARASSRCPGQMRNRVPHRHRNHAFPTWAM